MGSGLSPQGLSRPRCARCALPLRTCLCACVRRVTARTPVHVLQHPAEAAQAKNSVRLLRACLRPCAVEPGPAVLQAGDCLLYPGGEEVRPGLAVGRLWVLDGSWRQSRALLRAQPQLATLPRLSLPAALVAQPPRYAQLRKAQRPGQWSTLEAVAAALARLEGDAAMEVQLGEALEDWLALQAAQRPD